MQLDTTADSSQAAAYPGCARKFARLLWAEGVDQGAESVPEAPRTDRAAALPKGALSLSKAVSLGSNSGEYYQALFQIGKETHTVHPTVDHQRRYNAIVAQACHKGDGLPMASR